MQNIETYLIDKETHLKKEKVSLKYDIKSSKVSFFSETIGELSFQEIDLLEGYRKIQDLLEDKGYLLCLNGSRFDVQSSGLLRDSSKGISTYLFTDKFDEEKEILNVFDFCDINIGSKKQQKEYYKEWKKKYKNHFNSLS